MPSWWRDKDVYGFMMSLDETLETVGPSEEFKDMLAAWKVELAQLRERAGGSGRVEVTE